MLASQDYWRSMSFASKKKVLAAIRLAGMVDWDRLTSVANPRGLLPLRNKRNNVGCNDCQVRSTA
jgi:hypothetical protein